MRDLLALLGAFVVAELAVPLALWTAAALVAECALRATRAHAAVGLPLRSALVAALPAVLAAGPAARWLVPDGVSAPAVLARVQTAVLPEVVGVAPGMDAGPPAGLVWLGAALAVAVLVGGVACVRLAVACVRLRRLAWPDAPPDVQARAALALGAAGVRRPVRVAVGGRVPFTFGWRRPVVVVPETLAGDALSLVLAHEAAHIRAGDYAGHVATSAVAAVFAAHPLAAVLARRAALDRERLADAAVLARRPGSAPAYGNLLVSFASVRAPRLAVGAASSLLVHRLSAMTRPTLSPRRLDGLRRSGRLAAASLAILVTGLAGWSAADAPGVLAPGTPGAYRFDLINPVITVDGEVVSTGRTRMSTDAFRFFHVTVPGLGRVIVSDQPFAGATEAGAFDDARLDVTADGLVMAVVAEWPILIGATHVEPGRVAAYARFDRLAPESARLGDTSGTAVGVSSSLDDLGGGGGADDRGALPARVGVVRYAGVDLSRLENGAEVQALLDALPGQLAGVGAAFGEVRVDYVLDPDGQTRQFSVSPGPDDLSDAAVAVARLLRVAEDARPGVPVEGFFTLWHARG